MRPGITKENIFHHFHASIILENCCSKTKDYEKTKKTKPDHFHVFIILDNSCNETKDY